MELSGQGRCRRCDQRSKGCRTTNGLVGLHRLTWKATKDFREDQWNALTFILTDTESLHLGYFCNTYGKRTWRLGLQGSHGGGDTWEDFRSILKLESTRFADVWNVWFDKKNWIQDHSKPEYLLGWNFNNWDKDDSGKNRFAGSSRENRDQVWIC